MWIGTSTLGTSDAYHIRGIRLFGCKGTEGKTAPLCVSEQVYVATSRWEGKVMFVLEPYRSQELSRVVTRLLWICENGVTAGVHRHKWGGCYVAEINESTASQSLAFVLKLCN